MERVRHDDAVERRQPEVLCEVGRVRPESRHVTTAGEAGIRALVLGERAAILVHCVDRRTRRQEIRERERERAGTGAEVTPNNDLVRSTDAFPQQTHMVRVVHQAGIISTAKTHFSEAWKSGASMKPSFVTCEAFFRDLPQPSRRSTRRS